MKHLVFYDGTCGLCDNIVIWLLKHDQRKQFAFAPLVGPTAKTFLAHLPTEADSLILIENYTTQEKKISLYGKAAFRILWLLGSKWKLLGWLYFLPGFLYNWGYRLIASNRHRFFPKQCLIPREEYQDQFLS